LRGGSAVALAQKLDLIAATSVILFEMTPSSKIHDDGHGRTAGSSQSECELQYVGLRGDLAQ
jgi:hypothetical protein